MKCHDHPDDEATAICLGCGKALCTNCINNNNRTKISCSEACRAKLEQVDHLISQTHTQTVEKIYANARGIYLSSALFVFLGLASYLYQPRFIPISLGCILVGVCFAVWGRWLDRSTKSHSGRTKQKD